MPKRRRDVDHTELVSTSRPSEPDQFTTGPGDDIVTGSLWSVPGSARVHAAWDRWSRRPGRLGSVLRSTAYVPVRLLLLVGLVGLVAVVSVLVVQAARTDGTRPTNLGQTAAAPTGSARIDVKAALTTAPDVVGRCPVQSNCLSTMSVVPGLLSSVRDTFPGATITHSASVFDAAIPEVDLQQVVAILPDHTTLVLTQFRYGRGLPTGGEIVRTTLGFGLLIAEPRGDWVLTVLLTPEHPGAPSAGSVDAARRWTGTAPLPR